MIVNYNSRFVIVAYRMTVEVYFKSKIIFKINKLCCKCFTG